MSHGPDTLGMIREAVRSVCEGFPNEYWRRVDRARAYPEEFVAALAKAGWLGCLIPETYGGGGLGVREAAAVLEEIDRSGGNAVACHAQMYTMGTLLRHGSEAQKARWLPQIAHGEVRLQAFGVTEPTSGSDTLRLQTTAVRRGDRYIVNGRKVFISRVQHSDLMLLLARTTAYEELADKTLGLSVFLVDLRSAGASLEVRPIETMINHETNELLFTDLEIPIENLIGSEGNGFRQILDGMNVERILVASESIGQGRWLVARAAEYSSQRRVFGRPIGANQGVQFPIARAHVSVEAASLMRDRAADLFDQSERCGAEANMAKFLAAEAAWEAANACMDAFGGYGMAVEYDVERVFRESRLARIAPVSNNLVLAYVGQHVLGMPKSY